ncbi:hypothetical protein QK336_31555, partial [Pseudomonas aeruginosa]|nr:hypothetical protein [Pseudomonas aeruginosa]
LHRKALRVKSADFAKSGSLFQSFPKYAESIKSYQRTGETLAAAGMASQATVFSLARVVGDTKSQVAETKEMIEYLEDTQAMLDDFFKKR